MEIISGLITEVFREDQLWNCLKKGTSWVCRTHMTTRPQRYYSTTDALTSGFSTRSNGQKKNHFWKGIKPAIVIPFIRWLLIMQRKKKLIVRKSWILYNFISSVDRIIFKNGKRMSTSHVLATLAAMISATKIMTYKVIGLWFSDGSIWV